MTRSKKCASILTSFLSPVNCFRFHHHHCTINLTHRERLDSPFFGEDLADFALMQNGWRSLADKMRPAIGKDGVAALGHSGKLTLNIKKTNRRKKYVR
jgi:hypothetical protein